MKIIILFLISFDVFAAGGFSVTTTSQPVNQFRSRMDEQALLQNQKAFILEQDRQKIPKNEQHSGTYYEQEDTIKANINTKEGKPK